MLINTLINAPLKFKEISLKQSKKVNFLVKCQFTTLREKKIDEKL